MPVLLKRWRDVRPPLFLCIVLCLTFVRGAVAEVATEFFRAGSQVPVVGFGAQEPVQAASGAGCDPAL